MESNDLDVLLPKMIAVRDSMIDLANIMNLFKGNHAEILQKHGAEIAHASMVMGDWINNIKKEFSNEEN